VSNSCSWASRTILLAPAEAACICQCCTGSGSKITIMVGLLSLIEQATAKQQHILLPAVRHALIPACTVLTYHTHKQP
jgi:hypothetical protein